MPLEEKWLPVVISSVNGVLAAGENNKRIITLCLLPIVFQELKILPRIVVLKLLLLQLLQHQWDTFCPLSKLDIFYREICGKIEIVFECVTVSV